MEMEVVLRRRSRRPCSADRSLSSIVYLTLLLFLSRRFAHCFVPPLPIFRHQIRSPVQSTTARNVWWFGGIETAEAVAQDEDSCELVAVRIERTSANSRRIFGEICVPTSLENIWSILTDYDRLAFHVPNLVESRIVSRPASGKPGDGSYQCRLYQKGSQKIVGFEFGASVSMDMKEHGTDPKERRISFKCADSFFFQEFDGDWNVVEQETDNGPECVLSYVVDVRPKGPVPVAALEWRIREDVPTNLRAVKRAAMQRAVSTRGALARQQANDLLKKAQQGSKDYMGKLQKVVFWDRDETMAAYLDKP